MPKCSVIDLSHHNTIPSSLRPAREAGVLGVIHKLTEGTGYVDPTADNRCHLASESGMHWGLYHFLRPGSMLEQANYFLDRAFEMNVIDADTLLACDYEDPKVTLADVQSFMEAVFVQAQRSPVLYSGHVLKEKPTNPALYQYRLWLAQYGSKAVLPVGWSSYWLWQYTDQGQVAGVNPPTDCNDYQGTEEQLAAEWSGRKSQPQPEPEETVVSYRLDITAKGPIKVQVVEL